MSPKEIRVGATYVNRGKGNTLRRVLNIVTPQDDQYLPLVLLGKVPWFSENERPMDPIVIFAKLSKRNGQMAGAVKQCLYLRSFAQWAGSELSCNGGAGD